MLEKLALGRPETRAWALYDWANSAMYTVIVTAVFPIFFRQVAAEGLDDDAKRRVFAWATTASLLLVAFLAPVLGAISDARPIKKRLFAVFVALGVAANACLASIGPGDWRLACGLFGLVNIGAAGSFVFYDALLTSVARPGEVDRLSTSAYALGYLGGGLCLALSLVLILKSGLFGLEIAADASPMAKTLPTRIVFVFVSVWWGIFSLPFFRHVREPAIAGSAPSDLRSTLREAAAHLAGTLRELSRFRHAFLFLLAFLVYSDGIGTTIRMATPLGDELGLDATAMIAVILVVQFVGAPCALLFGRLAASIGAKRAILAALLVYLVICALGWIMAARIEITLWGWKPSPLQLFFTMAVLVGAVQGGAQALSRSLFASLVPPEKSGEFFGLFATLDKFAGVLGPLAFSIAATTAGAVASVGVFFVIGIVLLALVDVEKGRLAARSSVS